MSIHHRLQKFENAKANHDQFCKSTNHKLIDFDLFAAKHFDPRKLFGEDIEQYPSLRKPLIDQLLKGLSESLCEMIKVDNPYYSIFK